jgi:uncharacterized integral membrane protein
VQTPDRVDPREVRRRRRDQARSVATLTLAVLVTVFAVLNLGRVRVDWIVGSARAPLIVVIVVSLLVGAVLGRFAQRRSGRHR